MAINLNTCLKSTKILVLRNVEKKLLEKQIEFLLMLIFCIEYKLLLYVDTEHEWKVEFKKSSVSVLTSVFQPRYIEYCLGI